MTTMQINTEIYRNLGYLADSYSYLHKALYFLKKLSRLKASEAKDTTVKKIHVDRSRPLIYFFHVYSFSTSNSEFYFLFMMVMDTEYQQDILMFESAKIFGNYY